MHRNSAKITVGGHPVNWLGANFWSRTGGPLMWRNYDPATVREELRVLAAHGLNMTRSFFYWPDFMPEPDRIDEQMTARYADFLDRHTEAGLITIPTFLVGHMSGENWDPAWRCGRDLYGDVWMVARQAWFAGEMVRRFGSHPAVCGWLVSNEMPIYGGRAPRETIAAWAQLVIDAVRAAGGSQPISLGDGAWGIEITGDDTGYSVADAARLCDFLGPHVYPHEDDPVRVHYEAAWRCELAGTFGRPVVLEEFGVSSNFFSGANAARYYRQALHNTLLAGATGWAAWNNTDFDLPGQDPYAHHAFELHFGLTDTSGTPKPQLAEMQAFAGLLSNVEFGRCARSGAEAALVVPSYLETDYPFTAAADRSYLSAVLRQSYICTRLADLPVAVTRETDGIGTGAKLYLVPSTKHLLGPTWQELERLAHAGATVYVSYSRGGHAVHRGPWHPRFNEMFGVEHQLGYPPDEEITDDQVTFTLVTDFGTLAEGTRLTLAASGAPAGRGYLPVRPAGAEVLAVGGHGRPVLLRRRAGAGAVILCTCPLEHLAAAAPVARPEAITALYDAIASYAGVSRLITVDDPRVGADVLVRDDGQRYAWLVSQAPEPVTAEPQVASGFRIRHLAGPAAGDTVTLDPFGVIVVALDGREDAGRG
ncbi:MAG TPA: cellulase family glycosylhydrolase [Streptosporangiaceae bacterium]|jgi:endo-1,4-beta-mannosidase